MTTDDFKIVESALHILANSEMAWDPMERQSPQARGAFDALARIRTILEQQEALLGGVQDPGLIALAHLAKRTREK